MVIGEFIYCGNGDGCTYYVRGIKASLSKDCDDGGDNDDDIV